MSNESSEAARRERHQSRGLIGKTVGLLVGAVVGIIAALGLSIGLEWVGIVAGWWSSSHSVQLLITERGYVEAIETFPLAALKPVTLGHQAGLRVDELARGVGLEASSGIYTYAAINTVKLVFLRLAICLFAAPAFILVALVALFDGLVKRDIRKYTGGHESSYVFHKAKRLIVPSVALTLSVYLMLPISVPPVAVFGPTLLLTGAAIYTATSRFKKYL